MPPPPLRVHVYSNTELVGKYGEEGTSVVEVSVSKDADLLLKRMHPRKFSVKLMTSSEIEKPL